MRRSALFATLFLAFEVASMPAQTPAPKRGFLGRVLHPFGHSGKIPTYNNPKLTGLQLSIDLPEEPIKLTEMRQLPVTVRLTNLGKRAVELSFPSEQRIEILLHDSSGRVVTRWSENRAFAPTPGMALVNPNEHLEWSETIATRELSPGRVFTVEATVPAYPELDVKRKAIAAP
jgi:intracellular proteinase inhibitor BsuPI